jgi:hypothetical protein
MPAFQARRRRVHNLHIIGLFAQPAALTASRAALHHLVCGEYHCTKDLIVVEARSVPRDPQVALPVQASMVWRAWIGVKDA